MAIGGGRNDVERRPGKTGPASAKPRPKPTTPNVLKRVLGFGPPIRKRKPLLLKKWHMSDPINKRRA